MWFTVYMEHSSECWNYEIKAPEDLLSIERYLGSGAIKGVSASLAGRIVKKFRKTPSGSSKKNQERLAEVRGIQRTYGKRDRCTGRREKICGRQ